MKIHFVQGFCMGAQGAEPPKTPVFAPGAVTAEQLPPLLFDLDGDRGPGR